MTADLPPACPSLVTLAALLACALPMPAGATPAREREPVPVAVGSAALPPRDAPAAVSSRPRGDGPATWLAFVMNAGGRCADRGRIEGFGPSALGDLSDSSIAVVRPARDASARLVHSPSNLAALTGDAEQDGLFGELPGGDLDALGLRRPGPGPGRWSSRSWVLSTEHAWGIAWPATASEFDGALDGSLFSLERDGPDLEVRFFLREAVLTAALGQPHAGTWRADVDVDAFVQDHAGNVYLSFRHDEQVNDGWLEDDGVVCLPAGSLIFDGRGDVLAAEPGCARVVLDKAMVDELVAHAEITKPSGSQIGSLIDLQALALDPAGGRLQPLQAVPGLPEGVPHLLFNGQALGATVLSTRDGGSLARIDGVPLGPGGRGLGLDPTTSAASTADLNGLEVGRSDRLQPLVMTPTPLVGDHQPLEVLLANFRPGGWAWMLVGAEIEPPFGYRFPALPPGTGERAIWPWLQVAEPSVQWPVPIDRHGRARLTFPIETLPIFELLMVAQAYEVGSGELALAAAAWRP